MSSHELWNELGNLYFMSGAYNQAIHAYRRSIQMNSEFGRPYSNLGLAYVQQGRYEEAARLYRVGIDLLDEDKEKAVTWSRLGNVLRHLKDYREAILAYQHADELDPNGGENRDEPGQGLYTPSDPSFPLDDLVRQNVELNLGGPPDPVPTFMPGSQAMQAAPQSEPASQLQEDWPQPEQMTLNAAAPDSPEAEAVDPMIADAPINELPVGGPQVEDAFEAPSQDWQFAIPASESLVYNDPPESPHDPSQTVLESEPESQIYQQEADSSMPVPTFALSESRGWSSAEKAGLQTDVDVRVEELPFNPFDLFEHFEPEPADAQIESSVEYADPGPLSDRDKEQTEKAEKEIEKLTRIVQINPRNGFAWDTLGNHYKSLGSFQNAIFAYQQAISTNPSNAYYYHHIGLAFAAEGQDEDAIKAFEKVVEIDPDHSLAHATLGGYYRRMGLEDLAQQHIGKAMKYIFDSENEYNRACMQAICGNTDQAIELLQIALANKQTYVDWVLRDPDLDFIRQDPRFKQLISDFT